MTEYLKFDLNKLETILYFLLLLFLPTQFGKHFWPIDSFVLGQRIDYLSPTVYFTDILVFALLVMVLFKKFWQKRIQKDSKDSSLVKDGVVQELRYKKLKSEKQSTVQIFRNEQVRQKSFVFSPLFTILFLIFLLLIFVNIFFAQDRFDALYGWIKLGEIGFLTWYTSIVLKRQIKTVMLAFAFGIIFESILAILEFFHQGSMNGLFYYFGERLFSSTTPGIANASINGQLIMRPYATFSHPNVLAAYLVIGMTLLLFNIPFKDIHFRISNIKAFFIAASLIIGTIALSLTLSRVAILCWILVLGYRFFSHYWRRIQNTKYLFINVGLATSIMTLFFLSPVLPRFTGLSLNDESVVLREQLALDAFRMLFTHPFTGVGLNNFVIILPSFDSNRTSVFTIQPVHNIFLLVASQTGFIGFWLTVSGVIWIYLRLSAVYRTITTNKQMILFSLLLVTEVVILGSFDHYFLTLQQGQLLLGLVLGCALSNLSLHATNFSME